MSFANGEIAQLARAFGSYPCGQMSYRLIMAGYINWLDSSVLFLIFIYGIYFIVTYLCNKNIIREE